MALEPRRAEQLSDGDHRRDILAFKDEDGSPLVDRILDTAGQKGTGKWTAIALWMRGAPQPHYEAVSARSLSGLEGGEAWRPPKVLKGPQADFHGDRAAFAEDIRKALYAAQSYLNAQGYALMRAASESYGWGWISAGLPCSGGVDVSSVQLSGGDQKGI